MLELVNVSKNFGAVKAVEELSLSAAKGETVVLMGPSGCGKSTTIRMINRLIEPDNGQIYFQDKEICALSPEELRQLRRRIGYVFQQFNLISRLSVLENVMFGMVMGGMNKNEAAERAVRALDKVGLGRIGGKSTVLLSGGQQQRVAIARVLALEPEMILWDEPTASLDPILVREVLVIMEELARVHSITMLVVTHELSFALNVADKLILMDSGRIVETGRPRELFRSPQSKIGRMYQELLKYQMNGGQAVLYDL